VVSVQESAKANKAEIESALRGVKSVGRVNALPTDDKAYAYELAADSEKDLRPDLFRLVVEKGWVLLELHRDAQTLEDVFRHLTVGEAKRNRRLGAPQETEDRDEEDEGDEEEDEEAGDSGSSEAARREA
jgi:ABC-2 type transport system ATP-binding protein